MEENQEAFKTRKLAIIPIGSSEQHGLALPIGTDWIIAQYLAKMFGERTDKGMVEPVVTYGHGGNNNALYDVIQYLRLKNIPVSNIQWFEVEYRK